MTWLHTESILSIVSFAMKPLTSAFLPVSDSSPMTCSNLVGHADIFSSNSLLFLTIGNIVWTTRGLILWVVFKQVMVFQSLLKNSIVINLH